MRRFYIVPKSVIYETVLGRDRKYHDLFTSTGGAHYVDLDGVHILLCCDEFKRLDDEKTWHAHPEVARLHHATVHDPLGHLLHPENAHKQFKVKHAQALKSIGIQEHHTVQDLSDAAEKIHPLVSLSENY